VIPQLLTEGDPFTVFESRLRAENRERLVLATDLDEALGADQLFVLYQPMFDLRSARMSGVEALLRWRHPRRGIISPETFIPAAEETGLIVPIGRWVLEEACKRAAAWHAGGCSLGVAVNVSTRQIERPEFTGAVRSALSKSRLPPAKLTLEITESKPICDPRATVRRLRSLKSLGVRIAIDDFGSGYSSLAYLHQLPIDELKIDRSLITTGAAAHGSSDALIATIIQIAKALGIRTLAEGIEATPQLRRLQRLGCERGQGFLLARPLESGAVGALMGHERYRPASWSAARLGTGATRRAQRPARPVGRSQRVRMTSV